MLRYKADIQSLIYMILTTALLPLMWFLGSLDKPLNVAIWAMQLFMSVTVAVMAHNHNHLPIWRKRWLNTLTDVWLSMFYGFPVFAWIPTHNKNHHVHVNTEEDYTKTYGYSEKNNLLTLLVYPSWSGGKQQNAVLQHLKKSYHEDRAKFNRYLLQIIGLLLFIGIALLIDWKKALLFVIIPQQFSLFSVLIFNYVQHIHTDEESQYNNSRNFIGILNFFLLNNGYHTAHHTWPGVHWSLLKEKHEGIKHLIDPSLNEKSFWWYILKQYFLGLIVPSLRTKSMRLQRINKVHGTS
jgi:beta-carotene hydroxylase